MPQPASRAEQAESRCPTCGYELDLPPPGPRRRGSALVGLAALLGRSESRVSHAVAELPQEIGELATTDEMRDAFVALAKGDDASFGFVYSDQAPDINPDTVAGLRPKRSRQD